MQNYQKIKEIYQKNYNDIMDKNKVFFAFSNEQLEEGKKLIGITDNKLLTSIGMGGYLPKANATKMFEQLGAEEKRFKKELKKVKEVTEQASLYELNNHECFYTGDCSEVIKIFKGIYTDKQIIKVYKKFNFFFIFFHFFSNLFKIN
jgi:hypothetical protein